MALLAASLNEIGLNVNAFNMQNVIGYQKKRIKVSITKTTLLDTFFSFAKIFLPMILKNHKGRKFFGIL